jgi:hypothetical protein
MTLATLIPNSHVTLTDLPEAQEIVSLNIASTDLRNGSSLSFQELDWDADLPAWLTQLQEKVKTELVLASDCTYNSDSRYFPPFQPTYCVISRLIYMFATTVQRW